MFLSLQFFFAPSWNHIVFYPVWVHAWKILKKLTAWEPFLFCPKTYCFYPAGLCVRPLSKWSSFMNGVRRTFGKQIIQHHRAHVRNRIKTWRFRIKTWRFGKSIYQLRVARDARIQLMWHFVLQLCPARCMNFCRIISGSFADWKHEELRRVWNV